MLTKVPINKTLIGLLMAVVTSATLAQQNPASDVSEIFQQPSLEESSITAIRKSHSQTNLRAQDILLHNRSDKRPYNAFIGDGERGASYYVLVQRWIDHQKTLLQDIKDLQAECKQDRDLQDIRIGIAENIVELNYERLKVYLTSWQNASNENADLLKRYTDNYRGGNDLTLGKYQKRQIAYQEATTLLNKLIQTIDTLHQNLYEANAILDELSNLSSDADRLALLRSDAQCRTAAGLITR